MLQRIEGINSRHDRRFSGETSTDNRAKPAVAEQRRHDQQALGRTKLRASAATDSHRQKRQVTPIVVLKGFWGRETDTQYLVSQQVYVLLRFERQRLGCHAGEGTDKPAQWAIPAVCVPSLHQFAVERQRGIPRPVERQISGKAQKTITHTVFCRREGQTLAATSSSGTYRHAGRPSR